MVARMRAQHREWVVRRDREFAGVVEYVAERLPEWRDHPYFVAILWEWYVPLAGDLPHRWHREVSADCARFFARLPWPPRDDSHSISVAACRSALGPRASAMTDAQLRFLRDQLYVVAEMIVDTRRASKR